MKAIIMAAGKGTRMLPLTKDKPKPLIEVSGKPFLEYLLDNVLKAGFTDIGIVAGYKMDKIEEFINSYSDKHPDANFAMIKQINQRGTADAILSAHIFVGDEDFVAMGGDNLWSSDDMKRLAKEDEWTYIAGIVVEEPQHFGVLLADMSGKLLQEIKEKPKHFVGNLINTGLYKFKSDIFTELNKVNESERGELELTDAITALAENQKVQIVKLKDYWIDFGKIEDIPRVEKFLGGL